MSENGGLAMYMMYQALRLHFISDSYDYFKYNGKTNTSKESFLTHKNKYSFYKLSRNYSLEEARDFFVANFLRDDIKWVGELLTDDAETNYREWQKVIQSLAYRFENDVQRLLDLYSPEELLRVKSGEHPTLLKELMQKHVALETVVIMNDIMNFLPMWEKKIEDDIIWPTWQRRIKKYTPFLNYDTMKFRNKLKELYRHTSPEH